MSRSIDQLRETGMTQLQKLDNGPKLKEELEKTIRKLIKSPQGRYKK